MQTHAHSRSGVTIEGVRLPPGSVICEDDKYDSSDGKWRTCGHVVGLTIQPGCVTIWIRQPTPLSREARALLDRLNCTAGCIGAHNNALYLIPSPTFGWSSNFDYVGNYVQDSHLQELLGYAYLALFPRTPYEDPVYVLTPEGKREDAQQ